MAAARLLASDTFSRARVSGSGGAAVSIGSFRAAGDVGFFAGTALTVLGVQALGQGNDPTYGDYTAIFVAFAGAHLVCTAAIAALAARSVSSPR